MIEKIGHFSTNPSDIQVHDVASNSEGVVDCSVGTGDVGMAKPSIDYCRTVSARKGRHEVRMNFQRGFVTHSNYRMNRGSQNLIAS